jgi:hypothetical protein
MMKRLVVLGSVALAIGGVLLLSRFLQGKDRMFPFLPREGGDLNLTESQPESPESEFDGLDFLV